MSAVLRPSDFGNLIITQLSKKHGSGKPKVFNVSGGFERSLSMTELTTWCNRRFKQQKGIHINLRNRFFNVPCYVTDSSLAEKTWG